MELKIINKDGTEAGKMKMPAVFGEALRKDVIKRAVEAIDKNNRQPYGAMEGAGMRSSAKLSRRRKDYKGSYGHGISRVPRKIMSRRGTRFNWVGAFAPGTVGGRRAHPPKSWKVLFTKINKKENRLAIRSALSATMQKQTVQERGHKAPVSYPFILDSSALDIAKTSELFDLLVKLGFGDEIARTSVTKIRAGRGKLRGRRHVKKKGILFVTGKRANLTDAANNIPGCETSTVEYLNAKILAPGGNAGRITIFTKDAIERIENEKLFTDDRIAPETLIAKKQEKKAEKTDKTEKKEKAAKPTSKKVKTEA